ncbi:lipoprotein [Thermosulfidibacter takaii ABI70S6]|uniref:Lipoprotein n=1 Tax=Thermosulfidibacter takaii (strain DSM 17441 / JCM 13301 / NBRC 103674 / ABI70S6) TaxID=1298851 RepID=A0A0S3QRK0_THET7|nr:LptE family protein [Thermosulfidibacter takaii]BAT70921.1 lipoprotein [Thermosulfidibacter takaii ABI70S6]
MRKIVVLLLLLSFTSCGYRLVGTAPETQGVHLTGKKVFVEPFKNRTSEPGVEYYITNELVSSLQRTAEIEVVSKEDADYTITGKVVGYNKEVMSLDPSGDVSVYRLTITVDVLVLDSNGNEVAELPGISEYEDYRVYDEIERTKASEREATQKAAREIAQQIASLVL